MNIIIYETTHYENLSGLIQLSERCFDKITVFITEHSYQQIIQFFAKRSFPVGLKFEIQTSEITNREFIKMFFAHITANNYSHLHIGTLEHNMIFFAVPLMRLRQINISMTVHLINEYKQFSFNNLKNITESFAKLILHRKIKSYLVLAPAMEAYFKKCFPTKKVVFIPGNFYEPAFKRQADNNKKAFIIAIPGTVEAKRRDYPFVIQFLKKNISGFNRFKKIKVILLGNAKFEDGTIIVNEFQKMVNDEFEFQWFDEEVNQDTYNKIYVESDVIWNPIIVHTKGIRNTAEISSISISPGFITDQIRFGKPAIIPKGIVVNDNLLECNFLYNDEIELKDIFIQILSNPGILSLKNIQTAKACEYFNIENFDQNFKILIS